MLVRTLQWFFIDLFTGRFQWQEFVRRGAFMAGTAVLPTILVALPLGVTLSIQFSILAGRGATSLSGAASGLAVVRQAASLVAAMLMAAAVGSAITADLGSTMREETAAMEVMGVSVVRRLVVPRFAAAIMAGFALTGLVCFTASGQLSVQRLLPERAPGSFVATFASFATTGT